MGAAKTMSNIPASERRATKIDFFDKAIDIRKKAVEYIDCDFGISKRVFAVSIILINRDRQCFFP